MFPLAVILFCCLACQVLKGPPLLGSFSVTLCIRHVTYHPLWGLSLLFSCWCWHLGSEKLQWMFHPLHVTQQYCLASKAAWFSSRSISLHDLLPHTPSGYLPTVKSRPHPEIALQYLCSNSQPLCFLRDLRPCPALCAAVTRIVCVILIPFRTVTDQLLHSQPQMLLCSKQCPNVGIWSLLQFLSHTATPCQVQVQSCSLSSFSHLLPSSYQILHGPVYYFLATRYSCPLSDGVLQYLLCLKVYSWCIHGERCIPGPPTPPPSCSPYFPTSKHNHTMGLQLQHMNLLRDINSQSITTMKTVQ